MAMLALFLGWTALSSGRIGKSRRALDRAHPANADEVTIAALNAIDAEKRRLGISGQPKLANNGSAAGARSVMESADCTWWKEAKREDADLVFMARYGSFNPNYLWRHPLLNPQDRAPCPEDKKELEQFTEALSASVMPVAKKVLDMAHEERLQMIREGVVKPYRGKRAANYTEVDGATYLHSDFPPLIRSEVYKDHVSFLAADALNAVVLYFVARGYTTWNASLDALLVEAAK